LIKEKLPLKFRIKEKDAMRKNIGTTGSACRRVKTSVFTRLQAGKNFRFYPERASCKQNLSNMCLCFAKNCLLP